MQRLEYQASIASVTYEALVLAYAARRERAMLRKGISKLQMPADTRIR